MRPASLASFIALGTYGCSAVVRRLGLPAVWNQGVAFSSFGDRSTLAVGVGFVALSVLSAMVYGKSAYTRSGIIMLWGGALGNLIDRLLYGSVMDYIPVPFWPGGLYVNVADLAIMLGCIYLIQGFYGAKEAE